MSFIGARYAGHAQHSGYELFCDLAGSRVWCFPRRDLPGIPGKVLDRLVGRMVGRRYYTFGNLITELYGIAHVVTHPEVRHHVLYGDIDVVMLPFVLRHLRRRVSMTVHLPRYRQPERFAYAKLGGFDTVCFLAEAHRRDAVGDIGDVGELDPNRTVVIPHSVDTAFFAPAQPAPSARPARSAGGHRTLLSVGTHLRDFTTLAAALEQLRAEDRFDVADLVIAANCPEAKAFADLAASGHVRFHHAVSDERLRELYQQASVVVLALHDAYANNALLEAMACGCAIVVSEVGAVREYLGDAGWYAAPASPASLAAAVRAVLADPDSARQRARAARDRSLGFGPLPIARQFRTLLEDGSQQGDPAVHAALPSPARPLHR